MVNSSAAARSKHSKTRRARRVCVVVAAYNEEKKIAGVLHDLAREGYREVIVVDDHSADRTGALARRAGATVLRHNRNRGQGAALRTGIARAVRSRADVIVTFDGDGQHQASEIAALVAPVLEGKADIVLGSRFLGGHPGMPWYKLVTLKGSIFVERVLLGVKLTDVHNGLRALSLDAASGIELTRDGMAHASEFIYEIKRLGLRYVEVPVTIVYDTYARRKGQSIFNAFRIFGEIVRMKREKSGRLKI